MGLGTGATAKVSQDERRPVILIVDDSAPHATMVADALETGGFETLVATSSAAAIAMFLETRTDAVILDVLMPHMDGYDVCARIRDFSDVPIIMLSALRNEAEIVQGLNAGADDYVTKPFNVSELIARVGAQLRRVHRQDENRRRVHIEADDLSIDLDGRRVSRGGTDIRP
ncbi:MAG: DNA-binding response regulator, partial [Chloroflexi bacterium]|nr:DNA-binding response regulator [Chloroflexota bacterium]